MQSRPRTLETGSRYLPGIAVSIAEQHSAPLGTKVPTLQGVFGFSGYAPIL